MLSFTVEFLRKRANEVTLDILKCLISSVPFNFLNSENILPMLVTCEVSKPLTLREVREEHPLNILPMSVTCEVSKPLTLIEVRAEQLLNILLMLVTCEVSKLLTLIEVRAEQL